MTATAAPISIPSWAVVDVLYAGDSTSGATVTMWTVNRSPSEDGSPDPLRQVCEDHANQVTRSGDWIVADPVEHADGSGGVFLSRQLTGTAKGAPSAVAGYWTGPAGVTVALASATPPTTGDPSRQDGTDLLAVLESFRLATQPRFVLTAEEVLALCGVTGLAAPPVSPTAYPPDASDEIRGAVHNCALGSLVARGLLEAQDGKLRPDAPLRSALDLLLDGDRAFLLSVQRPEGTTTRMVGGRDGQLAELAPGDGALVLSRGGAAELAQRYAAELAPGLTEPPGGEPFGMRAADLPTSMDTSKTGRLSGARQMVSLRGLRRLGDAASVFDSAWVEDADGGLWAITPAEDPDMVELRPAGAQMVTDDLAQAFDFSAS